jgi:3-oxoadipate enol-lactonase
MSATLAFDMDGPAGAPLLVLGSSLGTTGAMWEPQMEALTQRFRVLRFAHRGHGQSDVPDGDYTLADLGGDVLALLDSPEVAAERVCYAGVSLGGMVGMWLAAHAPVRIERLALVCTSAHMPPPEAWNERVAAVRSGGMEAVADTVVGRWFTPEYAQAAPETVALFRDMLCATPATGYAGCCAAIAAMDLRDELGQISAPTLVVSGVHDPSTPPDHGHLIASSVPGAQFALVSGAHMSNVEAPRAITELLLTHFAGAGG